MVLRIAFSGEILEPLFGHQHLIELSKETLGNGTLTTPHLGALVCKAQPVTSGARCLTQPCGALTLT